MGKQNTPIERTPEVLEWVDRNIHYGPDTGNIYRYWFKELCTCRMNSGYIVVAVAIKYEGRWKTYNLLGQHIAWYKTHGVWPTFQINHKNGKRDDNRIANLEPDTQGSNTAKGGLRRNKIDWLPRGVQYHNGHKTKKYRAKIVKDKKVHWLGYFTTAEEAHNAYLVKFKELYGFEYVVPLYSNVDYVETYA